MTQLARLARSLVSVIGLGALATAAHAGFFPTTLLVNTTGFADSTFVGAPDDTFVGIGGQVVVYDFGAQTIINRAGLVDFNVYEVDFGSPEFTSMTVWASADGVTFDNVSASAVAVVRIAGDETHSNNNFARSYDLGALAQARYIMIDGNGTGGAGGTNAFDLDAIGAHEVTPVPEPATTALMLAGLGVVGLLSRRRRRS